jgi:hypothetical protein
MNTDDNDNKPPPQSRGKVTLYKPAQLSVKTGISKAAILTAIKREELRCMRVNKRTFLIESRDAAAWVELLSTTQPGVYRDTKAHSHITHNNLLV